MTNTELLQSGNFTELTAEIVSAYVANNPVPTASLAELIAGLPRDYPMVAPSYAAARSALAKSMGLGRKPKAKVKPKRGGRK